MLGKWYVGYLLDFEKLVVFDFDFGFEDFGLE